MTALGAVDIGISYASEKVRNELTSRESKSLIFH